MELTQSRKDIWMEMILNKVNLCFILSFFSALGTIPYGYRYAEYLGWNDAAFSMMFGGIFALCAMLANIMLGAYSLLHMKAHKHDKINLRFLLVSTLGAVPYGFLCYFGYEKILPIFINIPISVIVVIVNSGIGYTAISNLLTGMKKIIKKPEHLPRIFNAESTARVSGFVIGIAISFVTYLAACSGITNLFIFYNQNILVEYHIGFLLAILSWIPCAALFAYSNQEVAADLYMKIANYKKFFKGISIINISFLIFCLASGTAIAQMTADSFSPVKNIPDIFKTSVIQFIAQHFLIIIALFSSAALNYFSIQRLTLKLSKKAGDYHVVDISEES